MAQDLSNPMISGAGAVYGAALADLADEQDVLETTAAEARELIELLEEQPELVRIFGSRGLSVAERAGTIDRLLSDRASELLVRFVQVVNAKGRLSDLASILRAFLAIHDDRRGVIRVEAWLAGEGESGSLAADLGAALGGEVELTTHRDDSLIGGLKIRIGDRVLDGSVATRIDMMRQRLVEAGRQKARAHAAEAEEPVELPELPDLGPVADAATSNPSD